MFTLHLIILKRLLCTLSLSPHGNLEVGQEMQPYFTDDSTRAQRGHMFYIRVKWQVLPAPRGRIHTKKEKDTLHGRSRAQEEAARSFTLELTRSHGTWPSLPKGLLSWLKILLSKLCFSHSHRKIRWVPGDIKSRHLADGSDVEKKASWNGLCLV